jgi:hypothetical protein
MLFGKSNLLANTPNAISLAIDHWSSLLEKQDFPQTLPNPNHRRLTIDEFP